MKHKSLLLLIAFITGSFLSLIGCNSSSYNIETSDRKDSLKYEPTGAKLKNSYRIRSYPKFTLQISGGLNLGMSELSSNYANIFDAQQFAEGLNFGVRNGYGVMAIGKLPIEKNGNIRLTFSAGYNKFQNNFLADDSPFGSISYNVMAFGVGLENSFNPTFRLKPYISAEIQANMINGKADINENNSTRNVKIKNSFRIGYMVHSGIEYMFSNSFGVNFGLKLTNSNQILKSSKESSDPNEIPLRDEKVDSEPIPEFAGFKNFVFTTFYMGFNFYFGVKDIIYRFNK
ncbi:MAG: hypothetical protein N2510_02530 [Ignavibacteria bacterium]|nr:hypothetical protein [Ignavibacteria bacterium]